MKKLFAIITMFILAAGVAVAQDGGKKADPTAAPATKQAVITNNCNMQNFCCMRAGRMTLIKDGIDVGMPADMTLNGGAKIATSGTLTSAKGKVSTLKEGDAIDMDGNICAMKKATPPAEVK